MLLWLNVMNTQINNPSKKFFIISLILIICFIYLFSNNIFYSIVLLLFIICLVYLIRDIEQGTFFILIALPLLYRSLTVALNKEIGLLFVAFYLIIIFGLVYENVVIGVKRSISFGIEEKLFLLFILYLSFSTIYISDDLAFGLKKMRFFLYSIFSAFLIVLMIKKIIDIEKFFKAIVVFGIFIFIFNLVSYLNLWREIGNSYAFRFTSLGFNPIWLARTLSFCIIGELYFVFKFFETSLQHIGKIVLLIILILSQAFFLLLTASRGPLVGLLISLLVIFMLKIRLKFSNIIIYFLILLIAFNLTMTFLPKDVFMRLLGKDDSSLYTNVVRVMLNIEAFNIFLEHKLMGIGFGSFKFLTNVYPHNIFSELLSETGLIGFVMFFIILIIICKRIFLSFNKIDLNMFCIIVGLFISTFINANLSGHLGLNISFWMSIGLIVAAYRIPDNINSNHRNYLARNTPNE